MRTVISINIGGLKLKNPVVVASGTFGYAEEFADFIDLKKLGAVVTKTITLNPRAGNPPPRTCETPAGMLNSVGLDNPGLEVFLEEKLPVLEKIGVPVIVSIASEGGAEEFIALAERLDKIKAVAAMELNVSCPNIRGQGSRVKGQSRLCIPLISQNPQATYNLVKAVRKVTKKTLITKLSPNVTDIAEIAQAAECAGSGAVSLVNTIAALSIDIGKRAPKLGAITGGLSGPAIRPVAVRMVWECYQKIKIPIVGLGGIIDVQSALEFFIAGASAVAVGTANFINPQTSIEIIDGIKRHLRKNKIKNIKSLIGSLKI